MRILIGLLLTAALLPPVPTSAQQHEERDVHLRNDCRLAAQVLQTGHPAPRLEWALSTIIRCSETGPTVVAATWRTASPGTVAVAPRLAGATRRFNDREVVDALIDVVRSREYLAAYRIEAMALLYSYARPGLYLHVDDLADPTDHRIRFYAMSGDAYVYGARETLGDFIPELRALLAEVVETEPEGAPRTAAEKILRRLPRQ